MFTVQETSQGGAMESNTFLRDLRMIYIYIKSSNSLFTKAWELFTINLRKKAKEKLVWETSRKSS
jgi:hypothetical protein